MLQKLLPRLTGLLLGLSLLGCQQPLYPLIGAPQNGRSFYLQPEYEPVKAFVVSGHLTEFANGHQLLSNLLNEGAEVWMLSKEPALITQTRDLLGQRFGLQAEALAQLKQIPLATESVWARDWAPLFAFSNQAPGPTGLIDYRYYPDRPIDDAVPAGLTGYLRQSPMAPGGDLQTLPVNVELEGGNVMCTAQNCFVSQEVLRRIEQSGAVADAAKIEQELEKYLRQEFWIVPRMPFESTGHIDIWAKLLNAKTVIVGEISEESLAAVPAGQQETYRQVRNFLEEQATGKTAAGEVVEDALATVLRRVEPGIQILRIPMPTPGIYRGIETFRTYTNSVLYKDVAIVPQYVRGNRSIPAERELTSLHELEVERIYKQAGYRVIWIRADNLIRDGGAWHCVVMQVPVGPAT